MCDAAGRQYSRLMRLRAVAMLLASAYNGMLEQNGHLMDLGSDELPVKRLTECTTLDPGLLPDAALQN